MSVKLNLTSAFLSQFFVACSSVAFHFYILKMFDTADAGILFSFFAYITFITMLLSLGQQKGLHGERLIQDKKINFAFIPFYFILGTFIAIAFWMVSIFSVRLPLTSQDLFFVLVSSILCCSCNLVSLVIQKQKRILLSTFVGNFGAFWLTAITHFACVKLFKYNIPLLLLYAVSLFLIFFYSIMRFTISKKYEVFFNLDEVAYYLKKCKNYAVISVLSAAFTAVPVIVCSWILDPNKVAMFVYCSKVAMLLSMPLVAINRLSIITYTSEAGSLHETKIMAARYQKRTIIACIPVFVLLLALSDWILRFGDESFGNAQYLLYLFLIPQVVNVLTGQTSLFLLSTGNSSLAYKNQFYATVVLFILIICSLFTDSIICYLCMFILPSSVNNILNYLTISRLTG